MVTHFSLEVDFLGGGVFGGRILRVALSALFRRWLPFCVVYLKFVRQFAFFNLIADLRSYNCTMAFKLNANVSPGNYLEFRYS